MKLEELSRNSGSHKGDNGKVLVIGGSEKYTGAPALSAQASLRAGSDLAKVLTSEDAKPVVAGFSENLITESYGQKFDDSSLEKALELEEWADATVIGPGLSNFETEAVREFAEKSGNTVVDAGAIKACLKSEGNIFTPHQKESEVLKKEYGSIKELASVKDNTVVVTGPEDRIIDEEEKVNPTGNAGMTAGGTGDVLTGIIASLWAQEFGRKEAARIGAKINGKAGERAYEKYGYSLVASDLLEEIPKTLYEE